MTKEALEEERPQSTGLSRFSELFSTENVVACTLFSQKAHVSFDHDRARVEFLFFLPHKARSKLLAYSNALV